MPAFKQIELVETALNPSQQIHALLRLRELLLNGEFTPGERLREIPIAKRLCVSRTPLRLAMTALQHEGLLEMNPRRGFVVRSFRLADIYDAIDIRGMLEGMAARLAVERLSAEPAKASAALSPLRQCVADLDQAFASLPHTSAVMFARYVALNERLHARVLELAQSDMLTREMDRVSSLPFAGPSSGFVGMQAELPRSWSILRIGQDQHHAILDAIEMREAARAENLLREHSRLVRRNLEIALNDHKIHHLVPGLRLIKDVHRDHPDWGLHLIASAPQNRTILRRRLCRKVGDEFNFYLRCGPHTVRTLRRCPRWRAHRRSCGRTHPGAHDSEFRTRLVDDRRCYPRLREPGG